MRMPISTAAPAAEPISLADMKLHLAVDHAEHDGMIAALIKAARRAAELRCHRSFVDQEWTLTLDAFAPRIYLPMPVVSEISSLTYVNGGVESEIDESGYRLDAGSMYDNALEPVGSWPAADGPVTIVYRAGSRAADVPEDVKVWIKMLVAQWYENREAGSEKEIRSQPSSFWDGLLDPYRVPGV